MVSFSLRSPMSPETGNSHDSNPPQDRSAPLPSIRWIQKSESFEPTRHLRNKEREVVLEREGHAQLTVVSACPPSFSATSRRPIAEKKDTHRCPLLRPSGTLLLQNGQVCSHFVHYVHMTASEAVMAPSRFVLEAAGTFCYSKGVLRNYWSVSISSSA